MRITILDYDGNRCLFSTAIGNGIGIWKDREMPLENEDYSIEFLSSELVSGKSLAFSDQHSPKLEIVGDHMLVIGKVYLYCEKGSNITLDLGVGDIDFVIDDSIKVDDIMGKYVKVIAGNVGIYDEHHLY